MGEQSKAEEKFIRQGLNSYVKVLESVREFESRIANDCQKQLRNQLPKLEAAAKLKFDVRRIKTHLSQPDPDGAYIEAGVQNARDYFSVGIWFGKEANRTELMAYASMYCYSKKFANTLYAKLEDSGFSEPEEWEDGWYIAVEAPIQNQSTSELKRAIRSTLKKWTDAGDKIRSVKRKQ